MSVRIRGLLTILGSSAVAALLYLFLARVLSWSEGSVRLPLTAAMPLVGVLIGAVELVSGVPFTQVASRWDALPRGVKAVLSLLVIVAAIVTIFGGGIWLLNRTTNP
jgi:hypothetical protein